MPTRVHPLRDILLAIGLLLAFVSAASADDRPAPAPLPQPATDAHTDPLYTDLGGHEGIQEIVDHAMVHYLSDDRIKDKFDNENIDRLKGMLTEYFCMIAGGPDNYKGNRDMGVVHRGLHLQSRDFNALVEDLQMALDESDIPFATQNRLLARLAPMHDAVVTR